MTQQAPKQTETRRSPKGSPTMHNHLQAIRSAGLKVPPLTLPLTTHNATSSLPRFLSVWRNTLILIVLCFSWYFTSGMNAVGSQRFVKSIQKQWSIHFPSSLERNDQTEEFNPVTAVLSLQDSIRIMMVVTTLQLATGFLLGSMAWLLLESMRAKSMSAAFLERRQELFNALFYCQKLPVLSAWAIPFLHAIGSLSTNIGFMYGSASLVQVIKLMEPVETLIVGSAVSKYHLRKPEKLTLGLLLSVVMVVTGACSAVLGLGKDTPTHPAAVLFSISSGLALSCRNVFKKLLAQPSSHTSTIPQSTTSQQFPGLFHFLLLSIHSSLVCCILSVLMFVPNTQPWFFLVSQALPNRPLLMYHALYNMSSLLVLDMVSAPTHSLLNVGKRFYNIFLTMMTFHDTTQSSSSSSYPVWYGILISGVGSVWYVHAKPSSSTKGGTISSADHQISLKPR